jgi:hypothetical protein
LVKNREVGGKKEITKEDYINNIMAAKASSRSPGSLASLTSFLSMDRESKKEIPISPSVKDVHGILLS